MLSADRAPGAARHRRPGPVTAEAGVRLRGNAAARYHPCEPDDPTMLSTSGRDRLRRSSRPSAAARACCVTSCEYAASGRCHTGRHRPMRPVGEFVGYRADRSFAEHCRERPLHLPHRALDRGRSGNSPRTPLRARAGWPFPTPSRSWLRYEADGQRSGSAAAHSAVRCNRLLSPYSRRFMASAAR